MKKTIIRKSAIAAILSLSVLSAESVFAQSRLSGGFQSDPPAADSSRKGTVASANNIFVSKTAHVSGEDVCGVIRITNLGMGTATIVDIADTLEVRFQSNIPPYPMPAGSTPNWFKIADVLIAVPGPIAPRKTVTINYCFSLCQASDYPGAASMRNVVHVRVANPPGLPRVFPALSNVFLPPILDCQACCLPNGSCLDTLPARCSSAGGLPRGMGTDCATTECKQACCLGNGMCLDVKVSTCQANGGTPKGLATNCATTECPSACCLPSGSCAMQLVAACAAAGGLHQGPHVDCATNECTQACCLPLGSCHDKTLNDCNAAGGEASGLGTDCATATCMGACCWEVGCTNGVSRDTCERLLNQGVYLGNGTTCETQLSACPTGACCETFDSCIDFASEQYHVGKGRCENSGGTYQGDGTVCADRSCAGACCWAIGCTNTVSERTCEELFDEGVYLGNDTRCETQLSACPTGACCAEGECIDFESEQYHVGKPNCENSGGTFLGDGSTCATANTTCRGACCWEVGCNNNVSTDECVDDFNGTYLGHDITCQSELAACPTGACCLQDDCLGFETLGYGYSEAFCNSVGGFYRGNGASCTATSCTEACCFSDGGCQKLLPGACMQLGGDPRGPGTNCLFPVLTCGVTGP